jgi:hypothetical protein
MTMAVPIRGASIIGCFSLPSAAAGIMAAPAAGQLFSAPQHDCVFRKT